MSNTSRFRFNSCRVLFLFVIFGFFIIYDPSSSPGSDFSPGSPIVKDWMLQDGRAEEPDPEYFRKGQQRREERLKTLKEKFPKIVFTKHFDLGGSHYAYTEAQSDAQDERNFVPGSALCLLELNEHGQYESRVLIEDPNGVIRDPDVSFDGKKIVFAWKKSDRLDDYHLYDYEVETGTIRQLTFGLGYADYEPCVLPDGDILFNSTRCVQIVDCWWTEVSNLYRCDKDGRFLRRLTYDQVHTNFPTIMEDGRIIYTRWDYNDRGQIFPQALFQMNPDGTGQTEYYGNNSWFPTTLMHSRGIPESGGKVVSVFSGHHNRQYGKLGILDITKGRQENSGTQLIAPIRETRADRIDAWGQSGDRFAFPYPINEKEFLVGYNSDRTAGHTTSTPFGIYWIDAEGHRELLAYDSRISSHQPVPLLSRSNTKMRESVVNPNRDYGILSIQDVYIGPGLEGIPRGNAKKIRAVALDFRTVGIGRNTNGGPAGGALISTPISAGNGTWDVKIPLGETPISEDGSACFMVPAKTPIYLQVIDENGHAIQTMRSWTTLQPGEYFSCIGCHENKNTTISSHHLSDAMKKGPQELTPIPGKISLQERSGFSFLDEIQPILDQHCIACHKDADLEPPFRDLEFRSGGTNRIFTQRARSLAGTPLFRNLKGWYYTTEQPPTLWMHPQYFSSVRNLPRTRDGFGMGAGREFSVPWNTPDLWTWGEVQLPEDWEPQSLLLRYFHDEDLIIYVNGKKLFSVEGFNQEYSHTVLSKAETKIFRPGTNYLAAHVRQTAGAQGLDFSLWMLKKAQNPPPPEKTRPVLRSRKIEPAFSLRSETVEDKVAKRFWPVSYLNLTNSQLGVENQYIARQSPTVNWINVQDTPAMLPPYTAGAARSSVMQMFDPNLCGKGNTHQNIELTREEIDKISLWIDLLVPAFGDYFESNAWNEKEREKFAYYETKRAQMNDLDAKNLRDYAAFLQEKEFPKVILHKNSYRNLLDRDIPDSLGKVDFEKPVHLDQIAIWGEPDFFADAPRKGILMECSNGFKHSIELQKTAERQVFRFPVQRDLTWIKFTGSESENDGNHPVFKRIGVYGIDAQSQPENPARFAE